MRVVAAWRQAGGRGRAAREEWAKRVAALEPAQRQEFERRIAGDLPAELDAAIAELKREHAEKPPNVATRKASELALDVINAVLPETVGGSADLTPSNNTKSKGLDDVAAGQISAGATSASASASTAWRPP